MHEPTQNWYDNINDLALVEAIRRFAREQDGGFTGKTRSHVNSGLIGVARQVGMSEEAIREVIASDRNLTIYEP